MLQRTRLVWPHRMVAPCRHAKSAQHYCRTVPVVEWLAALELLSSALAIPIIASINHFHVILPLHREAGVEMSLVDQHLILYAMIPHHLTPRINSLVHLQPTL